MITRFIFFVSFLMVFSAGAVTAQSTHPFTYADPAGHGFNSEQLKELGTYLKSAGSSALLLMADGDIIYEWGETEKKHTVHSIRKALINSLFGIKVAEGVIDTSETLASLGIDDISPLSDLEKSARVADLLKSRSGVYHPAAAVSEGMKRAMPERGGHRPGSHYYYNNWDFNVLGHILELKTGLSIYDLFRTEIAEPLGMHHYKGSVATFDVDEIDDEENFTLPDTDGFYQYERTKSRYPAYHFRMSARDMALYGQLFLNKGKWEGEQLIPAEWIETSTRPWSVYNPDYGMAYGMLWDVLMKTERRKNTAYYHTGTGVHMLGVYPAYDLVLIHRVDTEGPYTFGDQQFFGMINRVFGAIEGN